jgi:predicted amidohydrolase YtcJ
MPDDGPTAGGNGESSLLGSVSRRLFMATGAAVGAGSTLAGETAAHRDDHHEDDRGRDPDRGGRKGRSRADRADLLLVDGKIHTVDGDGSVVDSVAIADGEFLEVGNARQRRGPDTEVIDLDGRTVVPGIVDSHDHVVLLGLRPGYHTPLENATSIAQVQATLRDRRPDVPSGRFVTTIGGFDPIQFDEGRLPTRAELDAAVDDRPVFLQVGFSGPSVTNSRGKATLQDEAGVSVADDGSIESGEETGKALLFLRERQSFEDELRSTRDAMDYSTSVGVTTHLDQGAFPATGTPSDGAAHADPYEMHEPFLELHRRGELTVRLQVNFLNLETDPDVPKLRARLNNAFQLFGDEMMNTGGIGEFTAGSPFELFAPPHEPSEAWKNGTRLVAEEGWRNENHSIAPFDYQPIVDYWEQVHEDVGIDGLRWVLAHANFITEEYVEKLAAMDAGIVLTGYQYLGSDTTPAGPPFRTILDSDVQVGMHSDSAQIAPLNPWLHMYYATTGKDAAGNPINGDQQISREEALRLYTTENGWFLQEDRLGSVEPGNLADLVVLNQDYFSVPEERIKDVRSVLTVVDGDVVHDAGVLH